MIGFPTTDRDFEQALRYLSEHMPDAHDLPKPTLLHSTRVGVYLYNHGYETSLCIAGLLHDLVEDSDVTIGDVEEKFGCDVADLIKANTAKDELDKKIKYDELIQRCVRSGERAAIIKASDIIDNLRTYRRLQIDEGIQNMIAFGTLLLKIKPKEYTDKIFIELQKML